MPYAEGRTYYDADSHIMELPDWLGGYLDDEMQGRIGRLRLGGAGRLAEQAVAQAAGRARDGAARAELEDRLMDAKGWGALGAFDPGERSRALDLLGFDRQLVFPTFASSQFIAHEDREVRRAGNRALNRGVVDFCSHDERLLPVAFVPLGDPGWAAAEVERCLGDGAAAVQVSHEAPRVHSHTHPAFDGVWGALAEAGVPFVLHVGGARLNVAPSLHDNGLPPVTDFLGGGENIRSKDSIALSHAPELFLTCMAMDGVFDRFPGLRGAAIELGAVWVPAMLAKLDLATRNFRKSEPQLNAMALSPREYIHRQVWFTPFPGEPVGAMIDQAGEDLFMFSSDYPHPEGTRDPLGRFEATMADVSDSGRDAFYSGNFADLMGLASA